MEYQIHLVETDRGILAIKAGYILYAKDYLVTYFDRDINHRPHSLVFCTDEKPIDGDMVYVSLTNSIWEFRMAPCPLPYWGNPNSCKKITHCSNKLKNAGYISTEDIQRWFLLKEPTVLECGTEDIDIDGEIVNHVIL